MRRFLLPVCAGLIVLSSSIALRAQPGEEIPATEHAWLTQHNVIQKLVDLTNKERARYKLPPVEIDPYLCLQAQQHAEWMAKTGMYRHSGKPWPEIIYQGPGTAENAIRGWIYSPAHHGIMLKRGKYVGFGYMVINGRDYWVGLFY